MDKAGNSERRRRMRLDSLLQRMCITSPPSRFRALMQKSRICGWARGCRSSRPWHARISIGLIERRAKDHFTHLQVTIDPDTNLDEAGERVRAMNAKGLVADIALSSMPSETNERQRYLTDLVERFNAFNVTWAGLVNFENVPHGRALLKEMGDAIKKLDPYAHPRWTLAASTSAASISGGGKRWMGERAGLWHGESRDRRDGASVLSNACAE